MQIFPNAPIPGQGGGAVRETMTQVMKGLFLLIHHRDAQVQVQALLIRTALQAHLQRHHHLEEDVFHHHEETTMECLIVIGSLLTSVM